MTIMADELKSVSANLLYFVPPSDGSKPRSYKFSPPPGIPETNFQSVRHLVRIKDLRGREDSVTLDAAGFQFIQHTSKHTSFMDDLEIEKEYYPESIELIKKITGAGKVVLFDHTIRRRRDDNTDLDPKKRGPGSRVHVDQTPFSAANRVRRHLPADEAEERLKHRFQIINLWRPISHPAYDWPLALCDFRSINYNEDLVPADLVYREMVGETFGVKFNAKHEWKYVKGLTPSEAILIKCFDSLENGEVAVLTPHSAFEDPSTPENAPPRESIEVRALVFYDD
ncbi:7alpha-cephem-methoxylase p8 chain related protein [Moniliophthora roreri MCA 2997]|uniref:7alpha-cephem-methoxylase p8 chain related protein n=1 Tax=Moniliophthora roreri (strain MCA 2997) TaxID=1381753 RepID=V2XY72_MONRO|nr:7alpha-cephem-methoxylase p8 chain related protein [Moniliophthora roreri MCA 2997]